MILRQLLAEPELHLRLLVGTDAQLEGRVRWLFATELAQPGRYLSGGELVVSGMIWRRRAADSDAFVAALVEAGAVGLAAGAGHLGYVPDDVVRACERHRLPLIEVPVEVSFAAVTEHVLTSLTAAALALTLVPLTRPGLPIIAAAGVAFLAALVADEDEPAAG